MGVYVGVVASVNGALLTHVWDVRNPTLEAKNFSGVMKLTLLTRLEVCSKSLGLQCSHIYAVYCRSPLFFWLAFFPIPRYA
jgi:hypothetical protein